MKLLEDRVALITGAGSGIGRAIALAFADAGAAVAVADLNQDAADRVAEEIAAAGGTALALPLDVSQPEQVAAAVAETVAAWGGLDILVNSAGICPLTPLAEISLAEWNRVLAVNLTGHVPVQRRPRFRISRPAGTAGSSTSHRWRGARAASRWASTTRHRRAA